MTGQNGSGMLSIATIEVWKGIDPVPQQERAREPDPRQTSTSKTTVVISPPDGVASPPMLSVHLLGPFHLERADGTILDPQAALGRPHSILLFKLLLCHPERRVSRDQLTRIMWPGQIYASFGGSLDTAKSLLKTHLETVSGHVLLPRVSGEPPSFLLAGQGELWTDIDACEQFIRQAISIDEAASALPLWESAYTLFQRGELLAEDQDAYWYESRLVQERRKRLAKQRLQCAFRIADLSLELGESERAIAVLSEESEANPAHEDLALHLMELFAQRGQRAEALQCYARVEAALLERDAEPRTEIKLLADRLRSKETIKASLEKHTSFFIPQREKRQSAEEEERFASPQQPVSLIPQTVPFSQLWYVSHLRNPFFTGREELLNHLHDVLHVEKTVVAVTQHALCGLGGIGKTQVALEYAYRYRHEYRAIFWVKADTRENMLTDFLAMARLLELPEQSAEDRMITIAAVKRWFQFNERWLLILDNADDLTLVREFLPSGQQGHVLFTTRMQALGGLAYSVQVTEMDQDIGTLFLLRRAGLLPSDVSSIDKTTTDFSLAQAFVQEVGGLPLALDQAGAYIEETASSLQEYLDLYHTSRVALLQRRGRLAMDHPESVATTWKLTFTHIESSDPMAATLLRLCAFLDPDAIPEELLFAGLQQLTSSSSEIHQLRFNEAIGSLLRFSLIKRNADAHTITIHRLVQSVVRDNLLPEQQEEWIHKVVHLLSEMFPSAVEVTTWPSCEKFLPHALLCADWIERTQVTSVEAAALLNTIGYYLNMRARYETAKPLFERALRIRQQVLGEQHPDTAQTLSNLAYLYHHQDKFEEAMHFLQRSLFIRQHMLGMNHPDTATSLNALALLYRDQERYEEAEPFFQQALAIRKQIFGTEHPQTAHSLSNLAWLYRNLGKFEEAEHLYEQSLAIRERILGLDHPETATSLNGLALLYAAQKKYAKAEPLFQRAIMIRQQVLGIKHLHTTQSMNALALLYRDRGEYEKAETLFLEVLAIREQILGSDHPRTATSLHNLALLYYNQGKFEQAERLLQRALVLREQHFGREHPRTLVVLNHLTICQRQMKK